MTTTTFKDETPRDKVAIETNMPAEHKKGRLNHRQAALHHETAAKYHLEAANFHDAGSHEKAFKSTVMAYGHHVLAGEYLNEDVKHHAFNN